MKKYSVITWPAKVARQVRSICEVEAEALQQNAAFKPRPPGSLDHTINILMLQTKAVALGMLEPNDTFLTVPENIDINNVSSVQLVSSQSVKRDYAGIPTYYVPCFMYKNKQTPADEIPHILSYKCLDSAESFDMYKLITFERSSV